MLPEAPSLFSTTTGWPQRSVNFCAMRRAMMSVPPPGANPTTMRTAFAGYWAQAVSTITTRSTQSHRIVVS